MAIQIDSNLIESAIAGDGELEDQLCVARVQLLSIYRRLYLK